MARRRLRAAEWAVLIDDRERSGLTLPEFWQRRGLSCGTMQGWIYKPALKRAIEDVRREGRVKGGTSSQEGKSPAPSPAFLPVRSAEVTAPSPEPTDQAAIEVVLRGGHRVAVGPGFDQETLRRVVAALELDPC